MKAEVKKSGLNKSKAVAGTASSWQDKGDSGALFSDRRPEYIVQRKLEGFADNNPRVTRIAQLQAMANRACAEPVQRKVLEEEEKQGPLQAKFESVQNAGKEEAIKTKSAFAGKTSGKPANNTGLPDALKSGIEGLSRVSMDDVKVHYNSSKPAQLLAHAFAQGTDIHLAPGQEKHLPHEAWHVVQQKQKRVKPTKQMKGNVDVNDDASLEKEADRMGRLAQDSTIQKTTLDNRGPALNNSTNLNMREHDLSTGRSAPVILQDPRPIVQRVFIGDEDLEFERDVVGQIDEEAKTERLALVRSLVANVNKKYQQHSQSDGTDRNSRTALVNEVLDLQQAITHWRHLDVPKEAKSLFPTIRRMNEQIATLLKKLCDEDYSHKTLGGTRTETMASGAPLVATYLPALRGIARRVTASNTRAYGGSAHSGYRAKKRQTEPVAEDFRPVGFPARSTYGAKRDAAQLEVNEEGVCHEFAAAAFTVLQGKNIRVEVCGMKFGTGGHNLVVVGRDPVSDIGNYNTWGQGVVVVDIWKGVIDQQTWDEEGNISWTPENHFKAFKGTPLNEVSVVYDPAG